MTEEVIVNEGETTLKIESSLDAKPVKLAEILEKMGLSGPRIPAADLVGKTFIIYRGRSFRSSFKDQENAWFCVCAMPKTGELFTVVLGGKAVVDILEALALDGWRQPLEVTLNEVKGGRYGKYYILE